MKCEYKLLVSTILLTYIQERQIVETYIKTYDSIAL